MTHRAIHSGPERPQRSGGTVRVLHTVPSVGDTFGGPSVSLARLGPVERALGRRPTLLALDRPEQGVSLRAELERWFDLRLVRPGLLTGRYHGGRAVVAELRRLVPRQDLVVFHSVFDVLTVLGHRIARAHDVPYVVWPHGSLDEYDLVKHARAKRALAPLWRSVLGGARAVICTTEREAASLGTFGVPGPPRRIVPFPYEEWTGTVDRAAVRARLGLPADARIVLFLGRLDGKKGLPLLLAGFDAASRPGDVLVLAGRGEPAFERDLRRRAAGLRHPDRVHFAGWVAGRDKDELLAAADVVALVSDNENFGHAVVEAIRAGTPTLLSDGVYLAAELDRRGATVLARRETADVAAAIRALLDDPDRRASVAREGRRFVLDRLSLPAVTRQYEAAMTDGGLPAGASR